MNELYQQYFTQKCLQKGGGGGPSKINQRIPNFKKKNTKKKNKVEYF